MFTLATVVFAVVACKDLTRSIEATTDVTEDTLTVFPLRGSPLSAPTAFDLFSLRPRRVGDASVAYDVAVDTAGGAAILHPAHLVESGAPRTAILEATTPFESITEAPTSGYQDTAAVAVGIGETVIVRARNVCAGNFTGRDIFYAKLQLLEFGNADGFTTARFRIRTNPNCGFRSFADGLPEF